MQKIGGRMDFQFFGGRLPGQICESSARANRIARSRQGNEIDTVGSQIDLLAAEPRGCKSRQSVAWTDRQGPPIQHYLSAILLWGG
jgi:hypothetical protein